MSSRAKALISSKIIQHFAICFPNYEKTFNIQDLFRQLIIILPRYFHRNRNVADIVLSDQVCFEPAVGTKACFNTLIRHVTLAVTKWLTKVHDKRALGQL